MSQPVEVPEPHRIREVAESFGVDAQRYDRARPPYPDALVQRIVAAIPGRDVLDVGCGTGIEARQFAAAGCAVLGVEPDERMAALARRTGIGVEVATIEDWEPAGRQFDAVIAGTAWHWVDPVAGAAKAARVLRTGGLLAPFHHVFQPPAEVQKVLGDALRRVVPDMTLPRERPAGSIVDMYQTLFDKMADGMRQAGAFGEPEQWRYDWERSYTRDEWLDLLPTTGALTRLAPDTLAEVLDAVGAALDAVGGNPTMSYATVAVTAVRTG